MAVGSKSSLTGAWWPTLSPYTEKYTVVCPHRRTSIINNVATTTISTMTIMITRGRQRVQSRTQAVAPAKDGEATCRKTAFALPSTEVDDSQRPAGSRRADDRAVIDQTDSNENPNERVFASSLGFSLSEDGNRHRNPLFYFRSCVKTSTCHQKQHLLFNSYRSSGVCHPFEEERISFERFMNLT